MNESQKSHLLAIELRFMVKLIQKEMNLDHK